MESAKTTGRALGALILIQAPIAYLVNFVLLGPVMKEPGFLVNAAAHAPQVAIAVLFSLLTGAISVGMAITVWPIFRQYGERLALWLIALACVSFGLIAVENTTVMSMLSLSQSYALAPAADAGLFDTVGGAVRSARKWAHYTNLIVASGMLLVLYTALFRFALVPRLIAGAGVVAVLLQMTAFSLTLFGERMMFPLMMPMALVHLVLALWLVIRGFAEGASGAGRPGSAAGA